MDIYWVKYAARVFPVSGGFSGLLVTLGCLGGRGVLPSRRKVLINVYVCFLWADSKSLRA